MSRDAVELALMASAFDALGVDGLLLVLQQFDDAIELCDAARVSRPVGVTSRSRFFLSEIQPLRYARCGPRYITVGWYGYSG